MFCRFCGSHIADDSLFCARCGKRLGPRENPWLNKIVRRFYLKTPYPYFAMLLAVFIVWTVGARQRRADYSHMKLSFELDKKMDLPDEKLFLQALSVVVENTGATAVEELSIDLGARIEPAKRADVEADFVGRKLLILQQGHTLPLTVVLAGRVDSGAKKRILLNGSIQAEPPFKVTYEIREEGGGSVLASHVVER